jgi:hypothetical protein
MLRNLSRTFTALAVLFGSVGMAYAFSSPTTVYSSGDLHSTANATEMTANLIAEPFSISVASQIVAVDFYTREVLTGAHNATGVALASTSDSFKGSFYWYILNDTGANAPGSIKYSGVASTAGIDFTRLDLSGFAVCPTCSGFDVITNSITIPSVLLDAGVRYWLVIHNGNPAVDQTVPGSGMFWDTTNTNNSDAVQSIFDSASPPTLAGFVAHPAGPDITHVYRITGQNCEPGDNCRVPEPGTLALLGAGIGLVGIVRRFRRTK